MLNSGLLRTCTVRALLLVGGLWAATAQAGTIEITDLGRDDLKYVHFTVTSTSSITIEAVGGEYRSGSEMFAFPWIIDAETRNPVWSMDEEISEKVKDSDWLRRYSDDIRLRKGNYILYYFSGEPMRVFKDFKFDDLGDFMENLGQALEDLKKLKDEDAKKTGVSVSRLARKYYVRLTSDDDVLVADKGPQGPQPLLSILEPENDAYEQRNFTLSQDMELDIYALGEYWSASGEMVDQAWIADAHSGQRIWQMDYDNTDWAGGADKNRRFRNRLFLTNGTYVVYYLTDDSHTFDSWNSPPPYDPLSYGIQIFPVNTKDADQFSLIDEAPESRALVRIVGVGDNELRSQAFRLVKPGPVRVYALGEYDRYRDQMADYAWIAPRDSDHDPIVIMTGKNTVPAGGDKKNRQFDNIVNLDAGEYVVWYVSDGSHSYADGWNASPPHDQKAYGVTILPANAEIDRDAVELIDESEVPGPGLIVNLLCNEDNGECQAHFRLEGLTRLRLRGMGEGTYYSGMADYGWIENLSTGDVVWEMTYRKTVHAGGAEKNRLVDQMILLDKGEYAVHFVTDGSHSPKHWNADPPQAPVLWGITLSKVDEE